MSKNFIHLFQRGLVKGAYRSDEDDETRDRKDRYERPSRKRFSEFYPKPAISSGFVVGRHNILCCELLLHLISVGFLRENQANLKTLPRVRHRSRASSTAKTASQEVYSILASQMFSFTYAASTPQRRCEGCSEAGISEMGGQSTRPLLQRQTRLNQHA